MSVPGVSRPEITLTIIGGPCGRRQTTFCKEKISIGRGKNNAGVTPDFSLAEDGSVSRDQAMIVFENGQYRLVNRSKHNSTAINGHVCDNNPVSNGDLVEVGTAKTRIQIGLKGLMTAGIPAPANENLRQGIWLAAGGLILLLALILTGKVLVAPPVKRLPHGEAMRLAVQARNAGDLKKAIDLLQPSITNSEENLEFYLKTRALAKRFERARHFEDVLQLDQALDEWRIIGVSVLEKNDLLQVWVQTGQVARLEEKLKEIGR